MSATKILWGQITTVFLMPHERYTYLNSSIVREVSSYDGDVSNFVPKVVEEAIKAKYASRRDR